MNRIPFLEILLLAWLSVAGATGCAKKAPVGAIGMLRFRDFFQRLHAPTKATTLGVGGVLIASIIYSAAIAESGCTAAG